MSVSSTSTAAGARRKGRPASTLPTTRLDVRELSPWILDRHQEPLFLIDQDRNLLFRNRAAAAVIDAKTGFSIKDGKLLLGARADCLLKRAIRDQEHIQEPIPAYCHGIAVPRSGPSQDWRILVHPFRMIPGALGSRTFLLQAIGRLKPRRLPEPALRDLFGLTAREVRVVSELLRRETVQEVANSLSLSRETVRSHLKCAFRKCNVHSKTELVALMHCVAQFVDDG